MIAVRTSVQILLHQLLRNFNGHQRTAETHAVRHRPELNLFRHTVIMHTANRELWIAGSVAHLRRVIRLF